MTLQRDEMFSEEQAAHLGSQKSCQVDLRDHLAAAVALLLVSVLVVLHQVPDLDPALQVGRDHRSAGTQAVGASGVLDHVLCEEHRHPLTRLRFNGPEIHNVRPVGLFCHLSRFHWFVTSCECIYFAFILLAFMSTNKDL